MPISNQYLLIQNKGEAPIEGYTVLGYSSTRNCGVDGVIGQFGSGAKHAVNLCLRHGLAVWVYCGKTRLEFALDKEVVNDGLSDETVHHVVYRKNSSGTYKRAGWILDFGVLDWDDVGMGIREFISNAIDRTLREGGGLADNHLSIKIVDDKDRRAKVGCTRVYVAMSDEVREYFGQLGKRFLHFSDNPGAAKPGILTKAGRAPEGGDGAVIYREGVYVRTLSGQSLFDYNFSKDQIKIDECRNSSEYYIKKAISQLLGNADTATVATVLRSAAEGTELLETQLDADYMFGDYCSNPTETQADIWARAWEVAAGPDAVVCNDTFGHAYVQGKGYKPRVVGKLASTLKKVSGIKTADSVLTADERQGRTILPPSSDAIEAVDWAWDLFETANLTGGKERPPVNCFQEISKAGCIPSGFYKDGGVFIHTDIANDGQNNELRKTALEELTHYITGATDASRDFQNLLLDALVTLA